MRAPLRLGTRLVWRRCFTNADIDAFAAASRDTNPPHMHASAVPPPLLLQRPASASTAGRRLVHGVLAASVFSALLAHHIPGCVYLRQTLAFRAPIFAGDELEARVYLDRLRGGVLRCRTDASLPNAAHQLAITGTAMLLLPSGVVVHRRDDDDDAAAASPPPPPPQ